ncbi:unnamed protein product [Spirodela intermedia]|uniref:DUF3741 domain-containing protein n=1 Tax=Spirodela intermedia TaxID=51605 RepID=A0A7I8JN83_SPIIN|nr:unnamed protein product [Spirodela intermedia]CAA6671606.1 unnamed protein product [Spirodela intermedia]
MIDTWSKSPSFDGRAGDLSVDLLLKGALDLQESLLMLEKLQRSSELLTQSRRRFQGCSFREEGPPAGGAGGAAVLTGSGRFGSSRNGVEELRNVIRDNLYRQNLLSGRSTKPPPPPSSPEKPRAPNLIARLMGLEEAPPSAAAEKPDRSRKGLQDIIESMKVKGLLGAARNEETLLQSPALPYLRRIPGDEEEEPPIVIIKPMHLRKYSGEVEVGDPPEKIKSVASPPVKKTKEETRARRKLEEHQMKNRSTRSQIKTTNPPPARKPERRPSAPARNQVSVQRSSSSTKTTMRKSVESTRERRATKAKPRRRPGMSSPSSSPSNLSSYGEGAPCTITLTEGRPREAMAKLNSHRGENSPAIARELFFNLDPGKKTTAAGVSKLLSDCARELMASKLRRPSPSLLPTPPEMAAAATSANLLAGEISREIEGLRSCGGGRGGEEESFCRRLERDLRCSKSGAWHPGWEEVPPAEEARGSFVSWKVISSICSLRRSLQFDFWLPRSSQQHLHVHCAVSFFPSRRVNGEKLNGLESGPPSREFRDFRESERERQRCSIPPPGGVNSSGF